MQAMVEQVHQDVNTPIIGFRSFQLLKTQTLGIGSYGSVCKALCDGLLCAAKIIHPTLIDPNAHQRIERKREHRLPMSRFIQECEFMSAIRHPNIVQYLGTCQDPESGLPVLLMELMDDSLTHFLESSQDAVPYHIQVNFCHDITLAISYLHSNGIIHRDLSSNNVLLYGMVKAKVTDFGMAKLSDINPQAARVSFTMCPGTDAYMPPEAVKDPPVYTAKIDCFAIGTLIIQILTRCFPEPGDRLRIVHTIDPQFPTIEARVSEIERRQNHISQVDPNHPLLPIALDCLKDSGDERPSAQEILHRVAALKETPQFTESTRRGQQRPEPDAGYITVDREVQIRELQQQVQDKDDIIQQKDEENHQMKQEYSKQIEELQNKHSPEKNGLKLMSEDQAAILGECHQLRTTNRDQAEMIEERDKHLQDAFQQIESSLQVTAEFQTRIQELEFMLQVQSLQQQNKGSPNVTIAKLRWREASKAPIKMCRGPNAVTDGDMVYVRAADLPSIFGYNSKDETWNELPECENTVYSLAVIKNILTIIGGRNSGGKVTNRLLSLSGEDKNKKWKELFQSMPTKRSSSAAVCSGQALIVAGGLDQARNVLKTVEVMNINTEQWSSAADLPEPLFSASITICHERVYIGGGRSDLITSTKSVYTCSLIDLFQSCRSRSIRRRLSLNSTSKSSIWSKVTDLPVTESTCITVCGQLLAIGGSNSTTGTTSEVHLYHPTSNTWQVISTMNDSRRWCLAAVLPTDEIMVLGGRTSGTVISETDTVEIATVVY